MLEQLIRWMVRYYMIVRRSEALLLDSQIHARSPLASLSGPAKSPGCRHDSPGLLRNNTDSAASALRLQEVNIRLIYLRSGHTCYTYSRMASEGPL